MTAPLGRTVAGLTATPGAHDRAAQAASLSAPASQPRRDHGHRLVGPGGGRAGSGGRVGEMASAVKGSGGRYWPGIRFLGKDTTYVGRVAEGVRVGMEPGP